MHCADRASRPPVRLAEKASQPLNRDGPRGDKLSGPTAWALHDGKMAAKAKETTMNVKLLASSVAALAMLALASASQPAQARGHGGHGSHGHSMGSGGWAPRFSSVHTFSHPHHVHRFRHHRRFVVVGAYPYAYADG